MSNQLLLHTVKTMVLFIALALVIPATAKSEDTSFFTGSVPPNVVVILDNSGSMKHVVWHPLYHPEAEWEGAVGATCTYTEYADWEFDLDGNPKEEYWKCLKYELCDHYSGGRRSYSSEQTRTASFFSGDSAACVTSENTVIFEDEDLDDEGKSTWWDEDYMNWLFSENAHSVKDIKRDSETGMILLNSDDEAEASSIDIYDNIQATDNGTTSQCLIDEGTDATYDLYRRARITAAKHIFRDVICRVNQTGDVRFGLARFDGSADGGYMIVPADDYTTGHGQDLDDAIGALEAETSTPLAETLFNIYLYFMPAAVADRPIGKNGTAQFPSYAPMEGGVTEGTPVEYHCQRNFIILLTDGEPTSDDFSDTEEFVTQGQFTNRLIGDYSSNNTDPEGAGGEDGKWYLDDVAAFAALNDFHLGREGEQTIDTYTIGFTTSPDANDLLKKTAEGPYIVDGVSTPGNGEFFFSNSAEELTVSITEAVASIVSKTQFFTAATVPASRTTSNNNFYASFFEPDPEGNHFWDGHVINYTLSFDGAILNADGTCALLDDNGDQIARADCAQTNGNLPTDPIGWAKAHWDAGEVLDGKVPDPDDADDARTLYVADGAAMELFTDSNVDYTDLDLGSLTAADVADYASLGSAITDVTVPNQMLLREELVWHLRGCTFATVVDRVDCEQRANMLGDVFHGNPLLVGPPAANHRDDSYKDFKATNANRHRRLIVASNDAFVHAFDGGDPTDNTVLTGHGNGEEIWAFMPYDVRNRIKDIPLISLSGASSRSGVSDVGRAEYFVDGSPQAADVWEYSFSRDEAKTELEWKTLLMGGLRQGGRSYYALDITDDTVPTYLWEFPAEGATSVVLGPQVEHMGESWSEPVITKIRVSQGTGALSLGSSGKGYERWVAIFGAGYSIESDPSHVGYDSASKEGRAIFVVDVKTGEVLAQKYFQAGVPTAADVRNGAVAEMTYAVVARPAVFDLDGDGFADVIYIGDLGGNVWKWIMDPKCPSGSTLDNCIGEDTVNPGGGNYGQPNWPFELFLQAPIESVDGDLATMGDNTYRSFYKPITGARVNGEVYLVIGSGNRADIGERDTVGDDDDNQRIFVFIDRTPQVESFARTAPDTATSVPAIFGNETAGTLLPYSGYDTSTSGPVYLMQDLIGSVIPSGFDPDGCSGVPGTMFAGYYVVGRDDEKFITNPVISLGRVLIGSYIPASLSDPDPCEGSGTAWLWAFDVDCATPDAGSNVVKEHYAEIGGGVPSDIVISVGPDEPPDCSGLADGSSEKSECDAALAAFDDECQVKEIIVGAEGGIHNNCRRGKISTKPKFKAWRIER